MERRKALVVAGAVTISAFTGAAAMGATTGLLGFGGASAEPAPAATASPTTETRIVHIPGRVTPTGRAAQSTGAGHTSSPTLAATAPQATPPPASAATGAASVAPPTTGTDTPPPAPAATRPRSDDGHEYEAPEAPEAPESDG
jgi:hypothetical protein